MSPTNDRDVAIVGMACVFPGAPDLASYWRNIQGGVDAITEIPATRWEPLFHDPDVDRVDRFPVRRGGVVDDPLFDPVRWGVMPVAAQGAEPDQLVALELGAAALKDAGYGDGERAFDREHTAVILGRGNYIGAGMTRLEQHVRTSEQLVMSLRTLVPGISEAQLAAVKAEFQSKLGAYGGDTAIGLVPNLTASRLANRLDLGGVAYTVDGACASSLLAVDQACHELWSGRARLALAGGVHLTHDVAFWSVFTQLQALSKKGQIRPFDRKADGLLPGEGAGIVALKRRVDAERDGDRIYAVVRAVGLASDGRGASLMVPRVEGQLLALERAWRAAGIEPARIGLVEAHGTATPVGDEAELTTLGRFFGPPEEGAPRVGLGSVKSMIGHAMPAAGAAGLIKTALAVHHGVLPPTLHCDEPHEAMARTRFRPLSAAEPWEQAPAARVAAVNAFGFGGINAHVVLQGHGAPVRRRLAPGEHEEILLLAAESPAALLAALDEGRAEIGRGPCRLALVNPSLERRAKAREVIVAGKARRGRDGLWFAPAGLVHAGGRVAFLFPGVEASFEDRVSDVAAHFGWEVPAELLAPPDLEHQGAAIVHSARVLDGALRAVGVRPDLVAGHSVGEWSAMIAAGVIPQAALDAFLASLEPGTLEVPGVVFGAVGAGAAQVEALLDGIDGVVVTHDNCPHQVILCGREEAMDEALVRLREARLLGQKLPFRSGFHSPMFSAYLAPHKDNFGRLGIQPPQLPLWSATTCAPYPAEPKAIEALALAHLVQPVRFRELIEKLHDEGVRVFVQMGGGSLVGFVADTLRGREHVALAASVPQRSGLNQLRRTVAALFVEGVDVDWARIAPPARPAQPRKGAGIRLALGVPLVQLDTPLDIGAPLPSGAAGGHPILAGFDELMRTVGQSQGAVHAAWQKKGEIRRPAAAAPKPLPAEARHTRTLSVTRDPQLLDHCLIPQKPGWPSVEDRNPVVPMTMMVRMMLDAAEDFTPGRVAIALENLLARKWLAVHPEVEVSVHCRRLGPERVRVALEGYCEAEVVLAAAWPAAPLPREEPLREPRPSEIDAAALYSERWMFHGPAYQSVAALHELGRDGIRGTLRALPAEGSLLDAAGQLFGYWVMRTAEKDRLAMPIRLGRFALFGPEPTGGVEVGCTVWVRNLGVRDVRADMELRGPEGRVWATIEGWEDWRFETDARLWPVMHQAEHNLFADVAPWAPEGMALCLVDEPERSSSNLDYLARRFLDETERATWRALAPRRQTPWLYGRIAAKDAVRRWLWQRGHGPLFPAEIQVRNDAQGRPLVAGPFAADLRVSIAHKESFAVAMVAEGRDVGVDLERVVPREESFAALVCGPEERALLPEEARDEWIARFFCAKEVEGKRRGTGLAGGPKQLPVTKVEAREDRVLLRVGEAWVATRVELGHIVAWSEEQEAHQ